MPGKSENYYIGIWYKQVSPRTVVWVANRGSPVSNKFSSELRVSLNGCLALYNSSNVEIWSNRVSSAPHHSVQVVLLDDGNLVQLPNGSSPFPPNPPLWQSFDEPGDTWIPGSKIGFNKVTQRDISLTSWRNIEDPAPGPFLLKLGSNRSIELWKYYWPGHEWQRTLNFMNQFSYFDNQSETCLTYSQHKGSLISRYVLDPGGQIQLLSWQEFTKRWLVIWRQPAFLYEIDRYCGPYGSFTGESGSSPCRCLTGFVPASQVDYGSGAFYGGCYRSSPLRCDKTDRFWPIPVVRLPDNARISAAGSSKECETSCLSSCSCTAFSYNGTECSVWYVDLLNMRQDVPSGQTICINLAAEEFPSSNHKKWIDVSCVMNQLLPITRVIGRRLCWILYNYLTRPLKRKPTYGLEVCTCPPYHVLEDNG
ncbi:unnamed protein product [Linum tenue]|nr:unnamed protein product [Linum tenue]